MRTLTHSHIYTTPNTLSCTPTHSLLAQSLKLQSLNHSLNAHAFLFFLFHIPMRDYCYLDLLFFQIT